MLALAFPFASFASNEETNGGTETKRQTHIEGHDRRRQDWTCVVIAPNKRTVDNRVNVLFCGRAQ